MKKILISAFKPFGKQKINSSQELIKRIKNNFKGIKIKTVILPVSFNKAAEILISQTEKYKPDIIIAIAQAKGRPDITVERVVINIMGAEIPDISGKKPIDKPIIKNGPVAYFTTIPIRKITKALNKNGIPASISNSAGTYLCNFIIYKILYHIAKNNLRIKAGLIHLPQLPNQAIKERKPSMCLETTLKAMKIIFKTIK